MRTDDLIRALAADRPATAPTPSRMLVIAAAAGFAVSAIAFAAALGPRDDVAQAATRAPLPLRSPANREQQPARRPGRQLRGWCFQWEQSSQAFRP